MWCRLSCLRGSCAGLAACAALAAYYPFMPTRLAYLLGLVVVLGAVSAVAFSTSYQLVAWFRCVGGPDQVQACSMSKAGEAAGTAGRD